MKILFLTDNFPPEVNAPATRTFEHCQQWVKDGEEVTVITCFPNFPHGKVYDGYKNKLYNVEYIKGIKVIRVFTYITANEGIVKRTLDYISFMLAASIAGLFIKTDVVIATSPQFFTALAGRFLSVFKRKKWLLEIRDIWPESIKAVNVMSDNKMIQFFEFLEKRMYLKASKIVVVTNSFKKILINERNVPEEKIEVVTNGTNLDLFKRKSKDANLLHELGLEQKTIVAYIGTHGLAHALDFILHAAKKIKDPSIHFLFIGNGAEKKNLIKLADKLDLKNVTLLNSVSKNEVVRYLSIADIGLVNLKKSDLFLSVIPSKIFELCALQKPILLGVEGETKQIIESYDAGVAFKPEDEKEFIKALHKLISNLDSFKTGCQKLAHDYDRKLLAKKMLGIIKEL